MVNRRISFNSIYTRLFISFLVIISPMIILGIVMFSLEKQTIMTEVEKNTLSNVTFLRRNLESEVQNVKSLQYNLVYDKTLRKLVNEYEYLPEYDYFTMVSDVQQRLQVMKNSSNYIEDVILYIPGMEHSISADNSYLNLDDNTYHEIVKESVDLKYPVIFDKSGFYTVMRYPFLSNSNTTTHVVEVRLSRDKIEEF